MRKIALLTAILAGIFAIVMQAAPAQAQATRTWVSGVGDDANPCSRTAPCKTFAGAISKTAAGGEISVLDPGGFGAVTITKSISIINDYSGEAGILSSSVNGVIVNAGANDVIILRGLVIDGAPPSQPGLNGIRFIAGGALHVEKCLIKNYGAAAPNGNGILFAPSTPAKLYVTDTDIVNSAAAGILIQPTGTATAKASIDHSRIMNNGAGVRADGTGSTGGINVSVMNTVASGNAGGGLVSFSQTGSAQTKMMIMSSVSSSNGTGLNANGGAAFLRVGSTIVSGNATAATITNGATMSSYNTNQIDDNAAVGNAIPTIGPH